MKSIQKRKKESKIKGCKKRTNTRTDFECEKAECILMEERERIKLKKQNKETWFEKKTVR